MARLQPEAMVVALIGPFYCIKSVVHR